ncbi:MAG: hypothetical protein LBC13_02290, partial [Clostridiales bacterium]|nr:hypothetical protein [Clostridiales bacterium]
MKNGDRLLCKILLKICGERGIDCALFATDWIISMKKNGVTKFVYGYQFPNNDACSAALAGDKAGLYSALTDNGIAAVPHWFFMPPQSIHYIGRDDTAERASALAATGNAFVVKPNDGTGGEGVIRTRGLSELLNGINGIFKSGHPAAVSPFIDIEDEYRTVILNGSVKLIFRKERPFVVGDGISSLSALAKNKYGGNFNVTAEDAGATPESIPGNGVETLLNWRHNLGLGARAVEILREDEKDDLGHAAPFCGTITEIPYENRKP